VSPSLLVTGMTTLTGSACTPQEEVESHVFQCFNILLPSLPSLAGSPPPHCQVLRLGCAILAVVYYSFFLPPESEFHSNFQIALDDYVQSISSQQLKDAVFDTVKETDASMLLTLVLRICLRA